MTQWHLEFGLQHLFGILAIVLPLLTWRGAAGTRRLGSIRRIRAAAAHHQSASLERALAVASLSIACLAVAFAFALAGVLDTHRYLQAATVAASSTYDVAIQVKLVERVAELRESGVRAGFMALAFIGIEMIASVAFYLTNARPAAPHASARAATLFRKRAS